MAFKTRLLSGVPHLRFSEWVIGLVSCDRRCIWIRGTRCLGLEARFITRCTEWAYWDSGGVRREWVLHCNSVVRTIRGSMWLGVVFRGDSA